MEFVSTALDSVVLSRWQFGITTVYHFILVPLTIGLSLAVAIMQTAWQRTGNEAWLKATRFFGKLFLINFALGVATGIVQEFQFGMNWSEYSRYVGDIFGAPLAIEALVAFFLESTFLGLWIFGWGRISKKLHLLMIWLVAAGTSISALWILTANSWMQNPVGAVYNAETGRAELDGVGGFFELLTNPVTWTTFSHVITASWMLAGTFIAGIAIWWMTRAARDGSAEAKTEARQVWRKLTNYGLIFVIIGGIGVIISGHIQGQEMVKVQPMKMATAEAICVDTDGAAFTVAAFGECSLDGNGEPVKYIEIPGLASFLAENSFTAESAGVADIQAEMVELLNANEDWVAQYGDASQYDFRPPANVTFWSFRLMMAFGAFSALLAIWALWAMRKGRVPTSSKLGKFALFCIPMPFIASSFGWIFTEMGRQPFVVYPSMEALRNGDESSSVLMMTSMGASTNVPAGQILATTILFTVLYLVLGIIWFILTRRYVREGLHHPAPNATAGVNDMGTGVAESLIKPDEDEAHALSFGY